LKAGRVLRDPDGDKEDWIKDSKFFLVFIKKSYNHSARKIEFKLCHLQKKQQDTKKQSFLIFKAHGAY